MKQTITKAPTIQFLVELKEPGDSDLGWTLIQDNPKVYVNDSGEIFKGDKIIIDSGIRNTIKKGDPNPLEDFYNVGDKVRIISRNFDITGVINDFLAISCASQKDFIGLEIITEKPDDVKYRSVVSEEYTHDSMLSKIRKHLIYSGLISISRIHD